jgi:hypothetical protein
MKRAVFLCLLVLVPFILGHGHNRKRHQDDDDGDVNEPPYDCKFKGPDGFYNLEPLYKNGGNAYSAIDNQGNTFFFNFCGDLSAEAEGSMGCDPSAAVCVLTSFGAYINAGRPSEEWVVGEDSNNVSITYTNGDSCVIGDVASPYQTVLQMYCDDTTELNVTSVTYGNCQVSINAVTMYACPQMGGKSRHGGAGFMVILLPALCCCLSCLCVAACCRRRRRMCIQRKVEMGTYQPVPQEAPQAVAQPQVQQIPQPVVHAPQYPVAPQLPLSYQPYVVPMQYQFQPQYFQPPSYFYPQQQAPVAPLEQANDAHIVNRENQVTDDEKIARDLQAQFDREQ